MAALLQALLLKATLAGSPESHRNDRIPPGGYSFFVA